MNKQIENDANITYLSEILTITECGQIFDMDVSRLDLRLLDRHSFRTVLLMDEESNDFIGSVRPMIIIHAHVQYFCRLC